MAEGRLPKYRAGDTITIKQLSMRDYCSGSYRFGLNGEMTALAGKSYTIRSVEPAGWLILMFHHLFSRFQGPCLLRKRPREPLLSSRRSMLTSLRSSTSLKRQLKRSNNIACS